MKNNRLGYLRIKIVDILRGTNILGALNELKKQQFLDSKKLKEIEDMRFENILKDASEGSEHFKNKKCYADLNLLTKETIKQDPKGFFSLKYNASLTSKATSGSTGAPLVYYTTKEALSYMWAGIILSWEIGGYMLGDKIAFLAGSSIFKKDIKHEVFHKLMNIETYSTFSLTDDDIVKYLKDLKSKRIRIIYGYATALNRIAEFINERESIKFPNLKGIVSSAEVLTDAHRKNIEKAFGVQVYNQYGCNEGGVSAFECEKKHLHLINTKCKYEVDEDGNLISSDLINKGFFILRYFTGDKIVMAENQQCSCGRGFPIIEKVIGRSYDMVIDNNKKVLHAAFFNILFKQDKRIRQFQILFDQKQICINLNVVETQVNPQNYTKYVDIVKEHLCFDEYHLNINAPFILAQNSKHKYVVNTAA